MIPHDAIEGQLLAGSRKQYVIDHLKNLYHQLKFKKMYHNYT